jgi:prepilin-type N-terminal cleavage/methylation domain-containing protein
MKRRTAFTLIELLVVIAIIAILAAILFPVFAQAKTAAKSTVWLNSFKQVGMANNIYFADHDDMMPMADSDAKLPGFYYCFGCGRPDYIWYEVIQPYMKNWDLSVCPIDPVRLNDRHLNAFTGLPIPPTDPNYWYSVASRSNVGINYTFLTPWFANGTQAGSKPISMTLVEKPSDTLFAIDTIWDRETQSGVPIGGGNWVVEAPCVYDINGVLLVKNVIPSEWVSYGGWRPNPNGVPPFSWLEFGGAWPFFTKRFHVTMVDSSARTMALGRLVDGCDVKVNQTGRAWDGDRYIWDLR